MTRYDRIGSGYARTRRPDPELAAAIAAALGDARTVVNVGAGAGSYEPADRHVIAVEPSQVMAAQRPRALPPAIRADAGDLPLYDASVDAAMSVLSVHHWDESQERGVRELRRVARGPVVIVTFDAQISAEMWVVADYLPELAELDRRILPAPETLAAWLGGRTRVETVPIARDTEDWHYCVSFAGFAPAENARLCAIIVVDDPSESEETVSGGKLAAPIFAQLMDRCLRTMAIAYNGRAETASERKGEGQ